MVTLKTGALFVTGGFGYYNFVLNSTEMMEREEDHSKGKWVTGRMIWDHDFQAQTSLSQWNSTL